MEEGTYTTRMVSEPAGSVVVVRLAMPVEALTFAEPKVVAELVAVLYKLKLTEPPVAGLLFASRTLALSVTG